jgi:hypothetical protein
MMTITRRKSEGDRKNRGTFIIVRRAKLRSRGSELTGMLMNGNYAKVSRG